MFTERDISQYGVPELIKEFVCQTFFKSAFSHFIFTFWHVIVFPYLLNPH